MTGKRRADVTGRRFTDQFASVRVSRFRAMGVIDPAKRQAVIPFPNGKTKIISVTHTRFPSGGGWSYFLCPGCARGRTKLFLIDDAPLCWRCCDAMNIKHRSRYGFGRAERLRERDKHFDWMQAQLGTTTPALQPSAQTLARQSAARQQ